MLKVDNNSLIKAVKTAYDLLTEREKAIYVAGYRAALKSNEIPFKFVPDISPIQPDKGAVIFQKIKTKVCNYYKISEKELFNANRSSYLVLPRSMAINLARELTGFSYPQLSNLTEKDHTSLVYHIALRLNQKGYWKIPSNHAVFNQLKMELINEPKQQ